MIALILLVGVALVNTALSTVRHALLISIALTVTSVDDTFMKAARLPTEALINSDRLVSMALDQALRVA